MVLNTVVYKQKISSLLDDASCRRLARPPGLYGLPKIHKEVVNNIGAPTYHLSKYLAGLLSQLTGNSAHHVKNSFHFVQILESLRVQPEDLMVSFDVVSLFTNVLIVDSLELLSHHFLDNVLALFKHVLTSTILRCDIPVVCRLQCRNKCEDRHKHNKYLIV